VRSNIYQDNYTIRYTGANQYFSFGPYYKANLMRTPKVMYCPSAVGDTVHEFNVEGNRWNPDANGELQNYTRAGYGIRPMDYDGRPVLWRTAGGSPTAPPVDASTTPIEYRPYPKLAKFKGRALAADIFATRHRVLWRHKKGINVLYADGSARWYITDPFHKLPSTWSALPPGTDNWGASLPVADWDTVQQNFVNALAGGGNGMMAACWELLDREGGAKPSPGFAFPP